MPRNPLNPRLPRKDPVTGRRRKKRHKNEGSKPAHSARMKALWQDPVYRAKMKERDRKLAEMRSVPHVRFTRSGVPDGMTRAMVQPLWDRANELADKFIQILKDTGRL